MFVNANQSFSHSVTLRLTLCQTSRLDFEPFMGLMTIEHWITLPPRHTSHWFSLQYRSAEILSTQNTSTAQAQSAVLGCQYGYSVKLIVILRFVFFTPLFLYGALALCWTTGITRKIANAISHSDIWRSPYIKLSCVTKRQHPKKTIFCIPQNWARNCLPLP